MSDDPRAVRPSIAAMTESAAERFAGRVAVVDGEVRLSYAALYEEARSFGAALVADGVEPGDRVGIWAPNGREWIVALLGLYQAGAVLVPVNTRFKGREAAEVLSRAEVKVLVTVTDFLGNDYVQMLAGADVPLPDLRTIVVARGRPSGAGVAWDAFLARATEDGLAEVDRRRAALGPDDTSDILFTSGTTGAPKGVVMTHGRTMGVATDWVAMTGLSEDDRYVMVNPYFHMFGFKAGILACLSAGAAMYPQAVLDVDAVLALVAGERATVLPGAPTMYHAILEHPGRGRYDLSSLRVAVTGSADIPVELIRRIRDELPFSVIVAGYGLTEAGTASSTAPDGDPGTIATTVGRARPGFEIRVVDGSGAQAAPDAIGEIVLRGPTVMAGYLGDPDATAEVLSAGGWLRTGDLGRVDERGCLRVVGRSKDMFIVGGFNTYPAEIEAMLLEHPGVREAAVVAVPDERLGQVGVAFVVPRPPAPSAAEVIAWCRERMANYKVPRFVELIDELPLTASGKVRKTALRERAAGRATT
ncbi:fatty acid--CoA ligase [Actinomadura darangshiensis]|uniref:Fatty acid--CoA ligase n=1 Tax=Actinomadura darangshiensis TaxID=705336 RepID=A0A4R5BJQ1_9ACTN|nr:FadD3 family acyl-CoA ligase [Actinomadura darangshiensis]TDD86035.1 fatty acid--CoA ligase [Actinomadura darangshiensis]